MRDARDMNTTEPTGTDKRDLLLRLLPMSASLSGLCIAGVTLFRSNHRLAGLETIADDLLAICSFLFLIATYMSFWALRTRRERLTDKLATASDVLFFGALSLLVSVGFMMVYTIL